MTEQQIQTKIIQYLKSQGAYAVKVVQATKAGVPDILACYKGQFIGIEVKRPDKLCTVSKLQSSNLAKIKEAHGLACVAVSIEEVEIVLRRIDGYVHSLQSARNSKESR